MILPIVLYGNNILRKKCQEIDINYSNLNVLINDMIDTMNNADGIGIAAPQIGKDIRIFIINTYPIIEKSKSNEKPIKEVFINPKIIFIEGSDYEYNEGCLSIPGIFEMISRKTNIEIEYFNSKFEKKVCKFNGINARVIQHEYDHLEGKLFIDLISSLKKNIIKKKLNDIINRKVSTSYPIV